MEGRRVRGRDKVGWEGEKEGRRERDGGRKITATEVREGRRKTGDIA